MDDRTVLGYDRGRKHPIYRGSIVRSVCDGNEGNYLKIQTMTGTVLGPHPFVVGSVCISWDGLVSGHDCNGLLTDNSGWNLRMTDIEVIDDPARDRDPVVPPDIGGAFWL